MDDGPTAIAPNTYGRIGTELSRDAVVRRLRTYGITYLAGADPAVGSLKQTPGDLGVVDGDGENAAIREMATGVGRPPGTTGYDQANVRDVDVTVAERQAACPPGVVDATIAEQQATGEDLAPEDLIAALSASEDPRLRLALIPLFVLHPELADNASLLADRLPADQALDLQTLYTAAVYLQALWWTRLHLYKSELQKLPDLFSGRLGLPSVDERHGKVGLHALADSHASRSAYRFNWLASYQRTMDLLFGELRLKRGTS